MRNRNFFLIISKSSDLKIQCQVAKERLESINKNWRQKITARTHKSRDQIVFRKFSIFTKDIF